MTSSGWWWPELVKLHGVERVSGADVSDAQAELNVSLPHDHLALLAASNGLRLYHGYLRLFGIGAPPSVWPMKGWNAEDCWKFAWPHELVGRYLCFGETVWGDQCAYDVDDLRTGGQKVHFLDALRMGPRMMADTFADFAGRYLLSNASSPYDSVIRAAYSRFGPIPGDTHLVFFPPVLVTGEENLDRAIKLTAQAAMVLNGDLWTQLSNPPDECAFSGLDVTHDDHGRERVRVRWSTSTSPPWSD